MYPISTILIVVSLTLVFGYLYAIFEGIREGYYFHSAVKSGDVFEYNLHSLFWVQRSIVMFSLASFISLITLSGIVTLGYIVSSMMCFSLWHNGAYYATRNNLNPAIYKKRFKDNSITSTAVFEFSFQKRLTYFIIGFLFIVFTLFIYSFLN